MWPQTDITRTAAKPHPSARMIEAAWNVSAQAPEKLANTYVAGGAGIRGGREEDAIGRLKASFIEERRDGGGNSLDSLMMKITHSSEGDRIQPSGCSRFNRLTWILPSLFSPVLEEINRRVVVFLLLSGPSCFK